MAINWTDDIVDKVKKYWFDGYSAGQIASKLPFEVTRNAVIGVIHRKGWNRSPSVGAHNRLNGPRVSAHKRMIKRAASKPKAKSPSSFTATSPKTGLFVPGKELPREPMPVEDVPPADLVKFADLSERQCKWIYGDPREPSHGFCGKPVVPGLSWCALHKQRVFNPPQPRIRRPEVERVPTIADLEKV